MSPSRAIATPAVVRAAAIVFVVWTFGVVGAVSAAHSVHHLLDEHPDAGQCPVAAAAQHADGASVDAPRITGSLEADHEPPASPGHAVRLNPTFRPDEGRAPPRTAA